MAKKSSLPFIQVYCPELKQMIRPGEWTLCPYFTGQKLDLSRTEDALKQIFRCHVQCGCAIHYQFYEEGKLVTKAEKIIKDQESLRRIISLVSKSLPLAEKERPKKILLVDDDPDFLEMHSAVLKNKGYEVTTAGSAKECMDRLKDLKPDLVILDVMMEQFDAGFETCQKIKEEKEGVRVMLLTSIGAQTGLEFSSNEEVLKLTKADALLDKPISPKILIDEIEKLTGE